MRYEDTTVSVDGDGITIEHYGILGSPRTISFDAVMSVTVSNLGILGRWRLVGWGPGSGGRNWYGWDRARHSKATAYSFDVNRFWRPTVTPTDPESFLVSLPRSLDSC
ncbi:MAG: hypothetical protein M3112_05295 [Actinomycetia bacterium]|nr:hypothetical protein [Actinomycetes bacterium]